MVRISCLLIGLIGLWSSLLVSCGGTPPTEERAQTFGTIQQAMTLCNDTLKPGQAVRKTMSLTLPSVPPKADVMFASDLTSSMTDEVAKAKANSTSIMNQITNLISDTWFGAMSFKDYAKSFNHCNYGSGSAVLYGSGSDYPYRLDQKITVTKTLVSSAINTWTISNDPNTDYPASYTRALWEMYNDNNVGWRTGSKRFIILFGDALPHDCQFTVSPYIINTGVDPGRDANAGTSDDLKWDATTTGLKNNNVSLITLYSGPAKLKLGGGPPLNIFKFWEEHSQKTGGDAFQLDQRGNVPNNVNIADFIKQKVQSLSATIQNLTIELCKDQNNTYASWLSSPDTKTNVSSGTGPHSLSITVTPPNGTSAGSYSFAVCIYGDGVEYARETCTINVTSCQLPGVGDPCSVGVGACRRTGTQKCNAQGTALVCDATAGSPTTEICDNIDNDCDGQTDENWSTKGTACTVGTGACQRNGTYVCNASQNGVTCGATAGTPTTERCDNIDNDCDGQTDEDFSQKGQSCTVGVGECQRNGIYQCNAAGTALQCSGGPGTPTAERCDGLDNDCDGTVDEDFANKGRPCQVGTGECRNSGLFQCNAAGTGLQCSASPGTPSTERCDGLDNDCDGSIDENFANKGQSCTSGVGACRRTGTYVCASNGSSTTCNATAGSPTTERCDNIDNDCDGQTDENFANKGQSCAAGVGPCRRTGTYVCASNGASTTCSATAGTPSTERCDGIDNDCDGSVDENFSDKGKSCTSGRGECVRSGVFRCRSNGTGLECSATPGAPRTEVCDQKDNDCDGQTDEGCQCTPGTSRSCYSGTAGTAGKGTCKTGTQSCVAGQWGACTGQVLPQTEKCDGADNDCDGSVDEDFPDRNKPCTAGSGACRRTGTFICNTNQSGTTCNVSAGTPSTERCDGIDNDCDGSVDEDFTTLNRPCTAGSGPCSNAGTFVCNAAKTGVTCSATAGTGSPEKCDGLDNDCDGQTDEDFPNKGKACSAGASLCKRTGTFVCQSDGKATTCNAKAGAPATEVCDNQDNDCDGTIDENVTKPCATACGKGTQSCKAGKWEPCQGPQPKPETCDNKDEDCDGQIDEGLQRPCQSACGQGQERCQAGKWQACSAPTPKPESCDGIDNDCDGTVDEDIKPKQCQGACGSGTALCESGQFVGCTGLQPKPEVCDGVDNDCDGKTDNIQPRTCRSECGEGKETCIKGVWKDCNAPKPADEVCDGLDNNCDGFVDNKAPCSAGKGCYKGKCTPTCTEDTECGKGNQCVEGFCSGDPCQGVECPDGKACVGGHCVDACATITCPDGQVCREGKCRENSCYGLGCPGGQVCKAGKCEPDACLAATCKANEACRDGKCVNSCAWVKCSLGKRCDDGKCVDDPCQTKTCPNGKICVDGKCADDPCKTLDCKEGRVCDPKQGKCVDDPCLTLQCPSGQRCQYGQCQPRPGQEAPNTGEPPADAGGEKPPIIQKGGDAGPTQDNNGTPKPPEGCGCHQSQQHQRIPGFPALMLLLLLLYRRPTRR